MVISLVTSANTVGRTNQPRLTPSGRPIPPVTKVAPSEIPFSIRPCTLVNCIFDTSGPIVVDSCRGSPTTMPSAAALAAATATSRASRGMNMRVAASQDWPVLVIIAAVPSATACAISADGRIMFGDLPPSSCATRLTVGAAAAATAMPARVLPVNDTISTSGCDAMRAPTSGPVPLTKLNTPAGTPAAWQISANRTPDKGAISDGFRTIVQPAINAGATLQTIWFSGQFHGVISAHTPMPS